MKIVKCWRWVFLCVLVRLTSVEAQWGNGSAGDFIYQPDAYVGESEVLVMRRANVATISRISAPQFILKTAKPFFIRGWQDVDGCLAFPVKNDAMSMDLHYQRLEAYRNMTIGLVYARQLSDNWLIGAGFTYQAAAVAGYQRNKNWGYRLGAVYRLSDNLLVGTEAGRPARQYSVYEVPSFFPTQYMLEVFAGLSPALQFCLLINKDPAVPAGLAVVIRYMPHTSCLLRLGVDIATAFYWIGCGLRAGNWQLEIKIGTHPFLGVSPGMGIARRWTGMTEQENGQQK